MPRTVDQRNYEINRATKERIQELEAIAAESGLLDGADITIVDVDPFTGNPSLIRVSSAAPESAGFRSGNFIQRALEFLLGNAQAVGLAPGQPAEFEPDPLEQQLSSNAVAVHLQQKYKGIPVFQAGQTVRFAPAGGLSEVAGTTVTISQDEAVSPTLSVEEAVLAAAHHLMARDDDDSEETDPYGQPITQTEIDLSGFTPTVTFAFNNRPERQTIFESGPFGGQITGSLMWFPLGGQDNLRLAWAVTIPLPDGEGHFLTLVDAEDGAILYSQDLTHGVAARGMVYTLTPDQNRRTLDFPQPWSVYDVPIPGDLQGGTPQDWVASNSTSGNLAHARLMPNGQVVTGTIQDNTVTFNPSDRFGNEQKIVNAFYYVCSLHNLFYLLGFREQNGNFQGGHGLGSGADPVDVQVFQGAINKTATFTTPSDGSPPTMRLGLVTASDRHTAFDATVVFHEYTHGVTNRLVGGPANAFALIEPQCKGMGEGFSDYFACSLTGTTVVGSWLVNNSRGIRNFRYDDSFPTQTDNFGKIGQGRYTGEHAIGEIWCGALMAMNRNLVAKMGRPQGVQLGLQLVIDGLKLAAPNPSFLNMRDAILSALDNMRLANLISQNDFASIRHALWTAFAQFGMGPNAASNGPSLQGIFADFNTPPDLTDGGNTETPASTPASTQTIRQELAPALTIPENEPNGTASKITVQENGKIKSVRIAVQIVHTYIGDLQIGLFSPQGQLLVLQNRTGDEQVNLDTFFDSTTHQDLATLIGQSSQGDWWLGVRDLAAKDRGRLERWGLELVVEREGAGLQQQMPERYGFI